MKLVEDLKEEMRRIMVHKYDFRTYLEDVKNALMNRNEEIKKQVNNLQAELSENDDMLLAIENINHILNN